MINISCTTGKTLPLDNIEFYSKKFKKHSMLEISRVAESIEKDGFLFPIAVGKIGEHNYIIDGEATYLALHELKAKGIEIPEIPVYYVRCTEETIKKIILIGSSSNHMVTEISLSDFVKGTDIDLNDFGFNTGDLIEFEKEPDMSLYKDAPGGKIVAKGIDLKPEDFEGLLA